MKYLQVLAGLALIFAATSAQATQPTTYYIYDESGHVIGEYDVNGNPIQEHVYLGDRPVAVVQGGSSTGGTVDYVTTDQLNTPRAITDSSQAVLWSWSSDPFGNGNPTGSLASNVPYNLRFPGQYYDAETGHNYNYFRSYDAATGRYAESDPIGLKGGINSYAYVLNDPLSRIDRYGLCGCKICEDNYQKDLAEAQEKANSANTWCLLWQYVEGSDCFSKVLSDLVTSDALANIRRRRCLKDHGCTE